MPIKIRCGCGNILMAPDERIGQTGHCPACNRAITVELPSGEPESMSDTAESAKSPEPAGTTLPAAVKPVRRTLFTRLGTLCVYLLFLALTTAIVCLHVFTPQQLDQLEVSQCAWLDEQWQASRELLFEARAEQRTMVQKIWNDSMDLIDIAKHQWKEWRESNKKSVKTQELQDEE